MFWVLKYCLLSRKDLLKQRLIPYNDRSNRFISLHIAMHKQQIHEIYTQPFQSRIFVFNSKNLKYPALAVKRLTYLRTKTLI